MLWAWCPLSRGSCRLSVIPLGFLKVVRIGNCWKFVPQYLPMVAASSTRILSVWPLGLYPATFFLFPLFAHSYKAREMPNVILWSLSFRSSDNRSTPHFFQLSFTKISVQFSEVISPLNHRKGIWLAQAKINRGHATCRLTDKSPQLYAMLMANGNSGHARQRSLPTSLRTKGYGVNRVHSRSYSHGQNGRICANLGNLACSINWILGEPLPSENYFIIVDLELTSLVGDVIFPYRGHETTEG